MTTTFTTLLQYLLLCLLLYYNIHYNVYCSTAHLPYPSRSQVEKAVGAKNVTLFSVLQEICRETRPAGNFCFCTHKKRSVFVWRELCTPHHTRAYAHTYPHTHTHTHVNPCLWHVCATVCLHGAMHLLSCIRVPVCPCMCAGVLEPTGCARASV